MSHENEVDVSNPTKEIEALLSGSKLLSSEAKVTLLLVVKQATNQKLFRILAFLENEWHILVDHLTYLLKENNIPEGIPDLLNELRRNFLEKLKELEQEDEWIEPSMDDILSKLDEL